MGGIVSDAINVVKSPLGGVSGNVLGAISGGQMRAQPVSGSTDLASTRPQIADWQSLIDPNTGLLRSEYQLQDPGNRMGLDLITQEATRTGPSKWAQLQQTQQLGDISKAQSGATTQAMNQAAMLGGLSPGAVERMSRTGLRNKLLAQQDALSSIAGADEMKRMESLFKLPGAELAEAGFTQGTQQYNIDRALQEHMAKRIQDWKAYEEAMKGYAAERTAGAAPVESGFNLFDPSSWF